MTEALKQAIEDKVESIKIWPLEPGDILIIKPKRSLHEHARERLSHQLKEIAIILGIEGRILLLDHDLDAEIIRLRDSGE